MRNIYAKCSKCGKGIIFKLPRPGKEPRAVSGKGDWDGIQYRKNRTIKCKDCRAVKGKHHKPMYLTH